MAKTMGHIIRELRCARNLTQEQLAEHLNITAQAISKWENDIGMPDISQVIPIAHFFGVSTDVLFGMDEKLVWDELQSLIDEATAQDSYEREYALLKDVLKRYPGDVRLLSELLSCGVCLIADGDAVKEPERSAIFEECERAGKLILSYSKDLRVLIDATEWLIKLYCEVGESENAAELSETLPSAVGFNREAALARVCENRKKYLQAANHYEANISQFQRQLVHSLILCANMYAQEGNKRRATEIYRCAITMGEDFLRNNPIPGNASVQKNLSRGIERCKKTMAALCE